MLLQYPLESWNNFINEAKIKKSLSPSEEQLIKMIPNLLIGKARFNPTNSQVNQICKIIKRIETDEGIDLLK